jgi:hypothetical protein
MNITLRAYVEVDPGGFEPPTFSMPLRRAPNCAMGPVYSDQLLSIHLQWT